MYRKIRLFLLLLIVLRPKISKMSSMRHLVQNFIIYLSVSQRGVYAPSRSNLNVLGAMRKSLIIIIYVLRFYFKKIIL